MTETLANGYSSESTQRELSNEYQHDRVWVFFKNLGVIVLWTKVASALEGLRRSVIPAFTSWFLLLAHYGVQVTPSRKGVGAISYTRQRMINFKSLVYTLCRKSMVKLLD